MKVLFSNILAFFVFGENYIKMLNSKLANTFHESEMKETEKGQLIVFEEKWITNSHMVKKMGRSVWNIFVLWIDRSIW